MKFVRVMASCGVLMFGVASCSNATVQQPYSRRCELPAVAAQARQVSAPGGAWCVGKAGFTFQDPTRAEPFSTVANARRELALKVWYPIANPARQRPRAEYAEPEALSAMKAAGEVQVASHSAAGATMQMHRQYPVLLFSPGLGAVAEFYSGLLEDLASRGYVVVAINHPYISAVTVLPGGRVIPLLDVLEQDDKKLAGAAPLVVADLRSTLDWLEQRNREPEHLLGGHLDLTRIGALGHSFGGSAALQATRLDPRLRAAANLDGTIQGDLSGPWVKPMLLYAAGNDPQDASMEKVGNAHRGSWAYKVLEDAGHHDFTDGRWVLPGPVIEAMGDDFGSVDRSLALRILRSDLGSFFHRYLGRP
ncbi:alpha/beta hydrolase family protein [Pseudomonas piscis]